MRRRRFRSCLRGIAALLLLGQVAAVSAAGLRLYVWPTPPIYSGTSYSFGVSLEKQDRNDGIVHTAPFTFRTTLPPGVDYIGSQGSSWQCSAGGANLRDITCTYNTDLNFPMPQSASLGINAMVAASVVPGPVNLVGTIQNAQVPLPPNPICTASPSDSGCVSAATSYVSSRVVITGWGFNSGSVTTGPVAVWSGAPFEAGTQNILMLDTSNTGYGMVNTPVAVDVWLPTGFAFAGLHTGSPTWTCAAQVAAGHVRCTTQYMYDTQTGFISLRVNVANDVAVPGPLFVHAAISNNVQAAPADCVATPLQQGCARLQVPTRIPRVAVLVSDGISHSPQTYTLGQEQGPLVVGYRNIGEAAASNSRVYIQLPPQIEFLGLYSSSPNATCAVQGALASGQIVTCSSSGLGAAPFHLGSLSLRVFAHAAAASPGPLNVLVAVEQAAVPNATALLQSCAANPAQSFCAVHAIATFFPCALQFGAEGIFCDGLQPFVRP